MTARILVSLLLLLGSLPAMAADSSQTLVLSPTALGPLPLGKGATVSEARLRKLFPALSVKYEIGSGDSPDFHYFGVATNTGEVLFSIKSFIEGEDSEKTKSEVPIQILQVHSPRVRDVHGLKVGDRVADIIKKRGKKLQFGAGHHDALIGADEIYYRLITETEQSPEGLTMEDAVKGNWKIRTISWPTPAWE